MLVAADNFSLSRYLIVDALNVDGILAFYQKTASSIYTPAKMINVNILAPE